jgi:hypothetical protein
MLNNNKISGIYILTNPVIHSIMFTLILQISKLTKAVVLNSFPHGRIWQFAYKENVRCTRLMQRSLQVVITSLSTSIKLKYCVIKRISHYSIDAPGQLLKVSVAY